MFGVSTVRDLFASESWCRTEDPMILTSERPSSRISMNSLCSGPTVGRQRCFAQITSRSQYYTSGVCGHSRGANHRGEPLEKRLENAVMSVRPTMGDSSEGSIFGRVTGAAYDWPSSLARLLTWGCFPFSSSNGAQHSKAADGDSGDEGLWRQPVKPYTGVRSHSGNSLPHSLAAR